MSFSHRIIFRVYFYFYIENKVIILLINFIAPFVEPIARWYTVLNYGVHALMYPYFALRAANVRLPTLIANLITTLQLAQMILGFTVNMLSLLYQSKLAFNHYTLHMHLHQSILYSDSSCHVTFTLFSCRNGIRLCTLSNQYTTFWFGVRQFSPIIWEAVLR